MPVDAVSYIAAFLASLDLPRYATTIAAVAASLAAIASWRAVRGNRKASEGKLLSDLLNEYAHEEMRKALEAVRSHLDIPSENDLKGGQRRMVSHYFQKVHRLREARLISEKFVRHAVDAGQVALFLRMEPLERELHRERKIGSEPDPSPFAFYARLYRLPRTTERAAPTIGAAPSNVPVASA